MFKDKLTIVVRIPVSIVYKPSNKNNLHDGEHQSSSNEPQ